MCHMTPKTEFKMINYKVAPIINYWRWNSFDKRWTGMFFYKTTICSIYLRTNTFHRGNIDSFFNNIIFDVGLQEYCPKLYKNIDRFHRLFFFVLFKYLEFSFQMQPSLGALRKRSSENMQQIYRRTPMRKCDFKTPMYGCFCALNSNFSTP